VQALCPDRGEDVYPYLARLMSLPLAEQHEEFLQALSGDNLKAGTFAALQTVLQCAADKHPLVLVCEDLQWADPTSIELLEEVLRLTDRTSLLLICVFRPLRERPSWRILEIAARDYEHRHLHMAMRPLSAENGAVLLSNLLRMPALMPMFQQRVLAHAEGNPFYVEEIVRSLIDDGALVRDAASGQWNAGQDLLDMAIPQTLQGVLTSRIDRLQEGSRRVLQMASVIGRIFHYRVLKAIATQEQQLDQHLLTLQREQMIRERARIPEREYAFKHELTREAAYGGLGCLPRWRRSNRGSWRTTGNAAATYNRRSCICSALAMQRDWPMPTRRPSTTTSEH